MTRRHQRRGRSRDAQPSPFEGAPFIANPVVSGADGPRPPRPRAMGLDVGGRRIGVAISDETWLIASPLTFVERGPGDVESIRKLIEQYQIGQLVIGMPTSMNGRHGPQAASVRQYADDLGQQLGIEPDYWDERLSTTIAERALIAGGTRRDDRRTRVDAVAAAVILQGYLDAHRHQERLAHN